MGSETNSLIGAGIVLGVTEWVYWRQKHHLGFGWCHPKISQPGWDKRNREAFFCCCLLLVVCHTVNCPSSARPFCMSLTPTPTVDWTPPQTWAEIVFLLTFECQVSCLDDPRSNSDTPLSSCASLWWTVHLVWSWSWAADSVIKQRGALLRHKPKTPWGHRGRSRVSWNFVFLVLFKEILSF